MGEQDVLDHFLSSSAVEKCDCCFYSHFSASTKMSGVASELEPIHPQSLVSEGIVKEVLLIDKGTHAQLISWKLVDFTKKGDNYACAVTSIEVKYKSLGQVENVTYVVKLNACYQHHGFQSFTSIAFSKETQFYMKLVPEFNSILKNSGQEHLALATCYYSSVEANKQQLYLADMRQQGFKMFDKMKGMDPAHARLVFEELGKLHAVSLLFEEKLKEPIEVQHSFLKEEIYDFYKYEEFKFFLYNNYLTSLELLKRVAGYERVSSWAEGLKLRLKDLITTGFQSDRFNVVNHGDCWNNNLIFRYNDLGQPENVLLLDLQFCRKSSLAIDLNYFCYTSLSGDVRKENLRNFLSVYYESFRKVLEAGGREMFFTEEELMKEFRDKNSVGGMFAMMVMPIILLESEEVPDMSGSSDEDMQKIMAEFKARALDSIEQNSILKPRFLSTFDEFMETGLIP